MKKFIAILFLITLSFVAYSQKYSEDILRMPKDTSKFGLGGCKLFQIMTWTDTTITGVNVLYRTYRPLTSNQSIRTAITNGWVSIVGGSSGGGSGVTNHSLLTNLDYNSSGHTGFQIAKSNDSLYYTLTERIKLNGLNSSLYRYWTIHETYDSLLNKPNLNLYRPFTIHETYDSLLLKPNINGIIHDSLITKMYYTKSDSEKLSLIEAGANLYVHPANHPPSIITQDASNRFVTDTEKSTWNAKQPAKSVDSIYYTQTERIKLNGLTAKPTDSIYYTQTERTKLTSITGTNTGDRPNYPQVDNSANSGTINLSTNTLTNLTTTQNGSTFTLGKADSVAGFANEYVFFMTTGASIPTITYLPNVMWVNNTAPSLVINRKYLFSFLKIRDTVYLGNYQIY